jgi:hypothetical protein
MNYSHVPKYLYSTDDDTLAQTVSIVTVSYVSVTHRDTATLSAAAAAHKQ